MAEAEYALGDMLWARVSGHPWWPCKVTKDPTQDIYTKTSHLGKTVIRSYHVGYYGDEEERGWITEGRIIPYKGMKQFLDYCANKRKSYSLNKAKRELYSTDVKKSRLSAWNRAVRDAGNATNTDVSDTNATNTTATDSNKTETINVFQKMMKRAKTPIKNQKGIKRKVTDVSKENVKSPPAKRSKRNPAVLDNNTSENIIAQDNSFDITEKTQAVTPKSRTGRTLKPSRKIMDSLGLRIALKPRKEDPVSSTSVSDDNCDDASENDSNDETEEFGSDSDEDAREESLESDEEPAIQIKRKLPKSDYELLRDSNVKDNQAILAQLLKDFNSMPAMKSMNNPQNRHSTGGLDENNNAKPKRSYKKRRSTNYQAMLIREPPVTRSSTGGIEKKTYTDPEDKPRDRHSFLRDDPDYDLTDDDSDDDRERERRRASRPELCKNRDMRTADEITEQDLEMIATNCHKKYDATYGTSCHQCRQKTLDMKTICRSDHCVGVRGQFCGPCLKNRYGEDAREALKNPDWSCPPCRRICNCSICRNRKGKRSTGILIHLARDYGYDDVNSYLQSLKKEIPVAASPADADDVDD